MTSHLYLRRAADCQRCLVDLAVQPDDAPEPKTVAWLPDSGADVDAIGLDGLRAIDPYLEYNLADDSDNVRAANGESLGNMGMFRAELGLNNFSCQTTIHIYRNLAVPLLSKASCIRLNLLEPGWPHCRLRESCLFSQEYLAIALLY